MIRYALATYFERMAAFVIDAFIITVTVFIQLALISFVGGDVLDLFLSVILYPFIIFYSLVFELLWDGQSPGKRALNLRVVRLDGTQTQYTDFITRWIFRGMDLYFTLGMVATLSYMTSPRRQRLGDILGNTVVVHAGERRLMRWDDLMKDRYNPDYKVTYPAAVKLNDTTALLIKETIYKANKFNNMAHNDALKLLVNQLCEILDCEVPVDPTKFLNTVLADYVVLTR